LVCLGKEKNKYKASACGFETLTNYKNCSQSCSKFLFTLSLSLVGWFSPVFIHCRLSEQLSGSQVAFGTTFILKSQAAIGKRVTGRTF
jgi:hypothetical protein